MTPHAVQHPAIGFTAKGRLSVAPLVLRKLGESRASVLANAHRLLDALPDDRDITVRVTEGVETRRQIQNRLAQKWCAIASRFHGEDTDDIWGRWKWTILLGLKLGDDKEHRRAMRERALVRGGAEAALIELSRQGDTGVSLYELEVGAALDIVRSKDIRVGLFAEWLSAIQRRESDAGCVLQTLREDEQRAMGQAA